MSQLINPVAVVMSLCDAAGIQSAYLFLFMAFFVAPVLLVINAVKDPSVLGSVSKAKESAFASMWSFMADPIDKRYASYKRPLLKQVSGVVLDLGTGVGSNLKYYDPSKISRILLVEPNPGMHANLRKNALKAGFREGQFEIVACGAEDRAKVEQLTGLGKGSVDSVTSVLALCGIPQSKTVIAALYEYLKPGGTFYFFEHVASKEVAVKKRQDQLTPLWRTLFGGCELNRATDRWILDSFEWSDKKTMTVDFESQKCLDVKSFGWAKKPAKQ